MRIDLVSWGDEISGLTLRSPGGKPVTAYPFRYSKAISYSGSQIMEIHQASGSATKSPAIPTAEELGKIPEELLKRRKESPTLVSLARLPSGSRRATILMAPAPANTLQAYVIDDDPSKLPVGKVRVHNLSPHPMTLRVGGTKTTNLAPKESTIVSPVNQELLYELAYQKDGEWIVLENNLIPVASDEQTQMIVIQSDSSHFVSADGSRSGYLQVVFLRRSPREQEEIGTIDKATRDALEKEARLQYEKQGEKATDKTQPKKP